MPDTKRGKRRITTLRVIDVGAKPVERASRPPTAFRVQTNEWTKPHHRADLVARRRDKSHGATDAYAALSLSKHHGGANKNTGQDGNRQKVLAPLGHARDYKRRES